MIRNDQWFYKANFLFFSPLIFVFILQGIRPHMFKSLIGKGHVEFSTNHQQDAQEYFLHFLEMLNKDEKKDQTKLQDLFAFQVFSPSHLIGSTLGAISSLINSLSPKKSSPKSKVEVTLCQRTPHFPASPSLIAFQFQPLVVSLSTGTYTPHPGLKGLRCNLSKINFFLNYLNFS